MSATAQNLSLGAAVDFTIDPTIPQSSQASVVQINDAIKAQVALDQATRPTRGGVVGKDAEKVVGLTEAEWAEWELQLYQETLQL